MSILNGGADDLIMWTLKVDEGIGQARTLDGRAVSFRERPPEAELTLHGVDREECEAVIALINDIRSRSRSISVPPVKPGSRFAGLEFE
jgi:hypothetical protein